jgi:hypothetical protein
MKLTASLENPLNISGIVDDPFAEDAAASIGSVETVRESDRPSPFDASGVALIGDGRPQAIG